MQMVVCNNYFWETGFQPEAKYAIKYCQAEQNCYFNLYRMIARYMGFRLGFYFVILN